MLVHAPIAGLVTTHAAAIVRLLGAERDLPPIEHVRVFLMGAHLMAPPPVLFDTSTYFQPPPLADVLHARRVPVVNLGSSLRMFWLNRHATDAVLGRMVDAFDPATVPPRSQDVSSERIAAGVLRVLVFSKGRFAHVDTTVDALRALAADGVGSPVAAE